MALLHNTAQKVKDKDGYCGKDFYIVLLTMIRPRFKTTQNYTIGKKGVSYSCI